MMEVAVFVLLSIKMELFFQNLKVGVDILVRFFASSPLFVRYIEIVVCQVIGRFYLWEIRCSYQAFRTNRICEIIARFAKI